MVDLSVRIAGLRLATPIMLASGTVGYGPEYDELIDFTGVGAVVTKTVTLKPRAGNVPPRLVETRSGLLNSIGLENVGLACFLDEKLEHAGRLPTLIVASVAGETPAEFAELCGAIGERNEAAALELNVSYPNVERARRPLWADPEGIAAVVRAARDATPKPLFLKLSPNAADVQTVAEAAESAGADALVVANTLPGMRIDRARRSPALGNTFGGLSGPALLPVNLALVWKLADCVSIPLIGSGGITSAADALEYMMAGASAFQMGTALFRTPRVIDGIVDDLARHALNDGVGSVAGYTGLAKEVKAPCHRTPAD
ncbi:dihydroorotate dehydrogenase [bacterium]|nr:dihydroorotate dehydrogenase [bacterium]